VEKGLFSTSGKPKTPSLDAEKGGMLITESFTKEKKKKGKHSNRQGKKGLEEKGREKQSSLARERVSTEESMGGGRNKTLIPIKIKLGREGTTFLLQRKKRS